MSKEPLVRRFSMFPSEYEKLVKHNVTLFILENLLMAITNNTNAASSITRDLVCSTKQFATAQDVASVQEIVEHVF